MSEHGGLPGQICENYDDMKYSLDYMVEAEILLE